MKHSTNTSSTIVWQAEEYHNLSFAQDAASKEIIQRLNIKNNDSILDVGCGNGKISARLSKIVSCGQVLGIDKSREMIIFARENFPNDIYSNLKFKIKDAQKITYKNQFNMVFSSFALQWIEDKNIFLQKSHQSLKRNGSLAMIIPTATSPELEESVHSIINLTKWKGYYQKFHPNWFFSNSKSIKYLVTENFFKINHFHSSTQEVSFPSREAFERYILLWFPYLRPLPKELKEEFFAQVLDKYFELLPVQSTGTVILRIPRIDLIATKLSFN